MFVQMTLKWCQILDDEVFNPTQSQKEKKNNNQPFKTSWEKIDQINVNWNMNFFVSKVDFIKTF